MPLNPLKKSERDLILSWRNAPSVRAAMYNNGEISLIEHRAWFDRMSEDSSSEWYLYRNETGPAGVAYFTELNRAQRTAVWGFYAKPGAQPGTGKGLMFEALNTAFDSLQMRKLNAEVLQFNEVSIHLHKKYGFFQEGLFRSEHFDGTQYLDVFRFGMFAEEWDEIKKRIAY